MNTRRQFGTNPWQNAKTGRWYGKYTGPDGKRHTPGLSFTTKGAVEGWYRQEQREIERLAEDGRLSEWLPPKARREAAETQRAADTLTVKALCEQWLADGGLKASTVRSHRDKLRDRVYSTSLSDVPVVEVTRQRIKAWWREVQDRWPDTGNSNSMGYKRLHTAFQYAVDELEILDANPVHVKGAGTPPRSKTRDVPLLTVDEVNATIEGVSERLKAPVAVLAYAGLRIGELLELRKSDLDGLQDDGPVTIRIRRTAQWAEGEDGKAVFRSFDTPKTSAANRDVVVSGVTAERLRAHVRRFAAPGPDGFLVVSKFGKRLTDKGFRPGLATGLKAAGRSDCSPHKFRSFFGTMLVTNGVPLEEARRLIGHETVQQLMDYQRAASGYEGRAAESLARLAGE